MCVHSTAKVFDSGTFGDVELAEFLSSARVVEDIRPVTATKRGGGVSLRSSRDGTWIYYSLSFPLHKRVPISKRFFVWAFVQGESGKGRTSSGVSALW